MQLGAVVASGLAHVSSQGHSLMVIQCIRPERRVCMHIVVWWPRGHNVRPAGSNILVSTAVRVEIGVAHIFCISLSHSGFLPDVTSADPM